MKYLWFDYPQITGNTMQNRNINFSVLYKYYLNLIRGILNSYKIS